MCRGNNSAEGKKLINVLFCKRKTDYFIPPLKPQSSASFQVECPSESHEPANLLQCPYWLFSFIYVGIFSNNQCKLGSHLCSLEAFHRHLMMSYLIFFIRQMYARDNGPTIWAMTQDRDSCNSRKKISNLSKDLSDSLDRDFEVDIFCKSSNVFHLRYFLEKAKEFEKNHLCTSFLQLLFMVEGFWLILEEGGRKFVWNS